MRIYERDLKKARKNINYLIFVTIEIMGLGQSVKPRGDGDSTIPASNFPGGKG
ncbi:MAG TPA: hypothetical protein PKI62_09485 [bacterium]|nr:hypothetical protein [bacterium]HPR89530.1 hypothetical protein [bacterium]